MLSKQQPLTRRRLIRTPQQIEEASPITPPEIKKSTPDDIEYKATVQIAAVSPTAQIKNHAGVSDDIEYKPTMQIAAVSPTPRPEICTEPCEDIAQQSTVQIAAVSPIAQPEIHRNTTDDIAQESTMMIPVISVLTGTLSEPKRVSRLVGQSAGQPKKMGRLKSRKTRKKRLPLWAAACSILIVAAIIFTTQGNGNGGAWLADTLRATLGASLTAQIESWYLSVSNTSSQVQYKLGGKSVAAPWKMAKATPTPLSVSPTPSPLTPISLSAMSPPINPALAGEGEWTTLQSAPAPYGYLPLDARSYIRPDPANPYALVTMLKFDPRFIHLHIVAGTIEPGGSRHMYGSGVIPAADASSNALLAAFNGGFKYADGQYGLMTNGVTYVPPQLNAATIAVTKEGNLILGEWGVNSQLNSQNTDLTAWRQNGAPLIDNGIINPLTRDGAAWGGTILNSSYTWRSAIGVTADGSLIYAAGNALTAQTLGDALKAAGVMIAMQTDINPFWVRAFLYNHNQNGKLGIDKLNPQMQGTGYEYINGDQRDFFYLTSYAPTSVPSLSGSNQPLSPRNVH